MPRLLWHEARYEARYKANEYVGIVVVANVINMHAAVRVIG